MNQENLKDKRIAVVGAGGVGGYLGAMLARTYGHVKLRWGHRTSSLCA